MEILFLPGIGASHRDFPAYQKLFSSMEIVRYHGCISLSDHLQRVDEYIRPLEESQTPYIIVGHSLGANLLYHYITHRNLEYLTGYSLIGGGPRFEPLRSWNTIFSLPSWGIAVVLIFIVLGAPFLFLLYGWDGMYQRVNVIDLFRREGITKIKDIYNQTLVPLMDDPKQDKTGVISQIIRLPNDLLFPQSAMDETRQLVPDITEVVIDRDLIHFSHHLDILVAGHIHSWLVDNALLDKESLPFDYRYAIAHPRSISVEVEGFALPRLPVLFMLGLASLLLIHELNANLLDPLQFHLLNLLRFLGIDQISPIAYLVVLLLVIISLTGYRLIISPENPKVSLKQQTYPKVSIIVPMRNEERNIEKCVTSLLHLHYPNYELFLADGKSTDRTVEITKQTIKDHNTMEIPTKIIHEPSLPTGWVGKSWGCWNAVQEANGEIFLFTDADTIHDANSLRRSIELLESRQLDGLSTIGKFLTVSFWEKTILPYFKVLLFILFGGRFANSIGRPLAIGQYIIIRRDIYEKFGGHEAVRSEIAEDIHLARKISDHGAFEVFHSNQTYQVRMYQSLAEIKEGLERNAAESVGDDLLKVIPAIFGLLLWKFGSILIVPLLGLFSLPQYLSLVLVGYLVFSVMIYGIDPTLNDDPWYYSFLIPLGIVLLILFLINASLKNYSNQPRTWKGREYSV